MAQPVPSSPAWKKPSDVMKVRLKGKKRRSASVNYSQITKQAGHNTQPQPTAGSSRAGKRRNPFGQSTLDRKRAHSEVASSQSEGQNKLFDALDANGDEVFKESNHSKVDLPPSLSTAINNTPQTNTNDAATKDDEATSKESIKITWKDSYPVDWCLKTRVRFISDSPFSWCGTLKTNEEACGLSWFTRGMVHDEFPEEQQTTPHVHSHWRSRLHQSAMVWMHPVLPWLKLFPRIGAGDQKTRSFVANDEAMQTSLMTNWCESFRSLYHQLRAGHCPYFYLCGYQSTVLFRAAGVGGFKHVHAMLTPTTKGLRETLAEEGVELSMPLFQPKEGVSSDEDGEHNEDKDSRSKQVNTEEDEEEDEEEEDFGQGDDAASSWLQSMGLDKQEFPALDPRRVKFQRDETRKQDKRPRSLVLISGHNTQALYNFLLNSNIMIAPTGSQADIPPTLISPAPFEGASLTTCKVKAGKLQQAVGNTMQQCYHLEVTGPILPSNIHAIMQLLKTTQPDGFSANMYNHHHTTMFSAVQCKDCVLSLQEKQDKLLNCNLGPDLVEHLVKGEETDDHATIQELKFADGKYCWICSL